MSSKNIGVIAMFKNLKCPVGSKRACRHLVVRSIGEFEKNEAMNLFKDRFSHVYDREGVYWRELLDINPTIVLEMNGNLVGVSNIRRPQLIRNRSISSLDLIAMQKDHDQMGLGGLLLEQSEEIMKKMGAKKAQLFTEVDNTAAVSFYSKHGWKVSERTEWGYQHGHRLTMEKIL